MGKFDELVGTTVNSWYVERVVADRSAICRCVCGHEAVVDAHNIVRGFSKSCGCTIGRPAMGAKMGRHGLHAHPLYRTWSRMIERCSNTKHQAYDRYGGRGIKVCERWTGPKGFPAFLTDMGEKPDKTTLERRDNDGHYTPENCYWATPKEQCRNKSNNRLLTHGDKTQCMAAWAEELKVDPHWLKNHLRHKTLAQVIEGLK